jgi:hypothetical protein
LIGVAVTALMLAGFFKAYPIEMFLGVERTVVLDSAKTLITHRAGLAYSAELGKLKLQDRAVSAYGPPELHVRFLENGVPLDREWHHNRIETRPGFYSHWEHYIVFSPRSGGTAGNVYSIRYLELDRSLRWLGTITAAKFWFSIAAICLLGWCATFVSLAVGGNWKVPRSGWVSAILLLGLAGALTPHVVKYWDVAMTTPDSGSYVHNLVRPPLYSVLIRSCTGDAAWSDDDFASFYQRLPNPSEALLRVIRTQRLVFWACFLTAAWGASLLVPCPLVVLLFFGLHLHGMLLPDLESSLMSEALALAFFFLVVAAFCIVVARRRLWPLPLLAAAYGCLVLTRIAGVFAIVFLIVAIIVAAIAHWQHKKALAGALASVGLVGSLSVAALLGHSHARIGIWALSPLQNWERVAFALQVADLSDIEAMPDSDARQFLNDALCRRRVKENSAPLEKFDLNKNCWIIADPLAEAMFVARFGPPESPKPGEPRPSKFGYIHGLFGRVAGVVLPRHWDRYLRIVAHSFFTRAAGDCTRLHWRHVSFLWLTALGFLGCAIGRNTCALAGTTCLTAHLGNLVIMSSCELPIRRYVAFSEWVCLFGFLLAGVGLGQRLLRMLEAWKSRSKLVSEAMP